MDRSASVAVMADSAAQAADLQPGDRMISIDDRDIASWEEMRTLIGEHPDREVKIQIEREDRSKFFRYADPHVDFPQLNV